MMASIQTRYGIIILAAGNSSRLGEPKQLLRFRNSSLLVKVVKTTLAVPQSSTVVVTGALENEITRELSGYEVCIAHNRDWQTGMASSIKAGISALLDEYASLDAVIITVCDQPFLTSATLNSLIAKHIATDKGIIASAYNSTFGTPVLFSSKYFESLLSLEGQEGAKKIVLQFPEDMIAVNFPLGEIDIDTAEDYSNLLKDL